MWAGMALLVQPVDGEFYNTGNKHALGNREWSYM